MDALTHETEPKVVTLETLPKAFSKLADDVSEIKRMLLKASDEQPIEVDRWFNLDELCNYHPDNPTKPTAYGWVRDGLIPCHKGAKRLRFLKSEIDLWLKSGKRKTLAEWSVEADQYIKNKKR